MPIIDRIRAALESPATRRLRAAEREAWQSATRPSVSRALAAAPFSGGAQPLSNPPTINWYQDQMEPPPRVSVFRGGYHDHTYQTFATPTGFEGFSLARIDNAVAMHRMGWFVESYLLSFAALRFGPVLAALQQAVAPILALPRHVHGGDRGLAKVVADEVREQLVPRSGLRPSPFLPPTIWGTMGINLRMMGFHVLQHTDGDPDPVTRIRPRYTRTWPIWATRIQRSPRKVLAMTAEAEIEIKNDGKFTLVCDEEEPELTGAILALGDEALGGQMSQSARQNWLEFFGDPKLYAIMPEKVATRSDAGDDFESAVDTLYGPEGRGVFPHGSLVDAVAISGEGSQAFQASLIDRIVHIYMVLTGSAGTIGNGMAAGAGEGHGYQPQKGGAWNIRHDLIARPVVAIVRGINAGHIAPHIDHNYDVSGQRRAGTWVDPVLDIPIMTPDREERIAGEISRYKALADQVKLEKDVGAQMTNERVKHLAGRYEVEAFVLAEKAPGATSFAYDQENGVLTIDQRLEELGKPATGDARGGMTVPEYRAWLQAKVEREKAAAEAQAQADITETESGEEERDEDEGRERRTDDAEAPAPREGDQAGPAASEAAPPGDGG